MWQKLCRKRNDTGPTRKRFGKGGVGCSILGNEVRSVGFWHLSHVNLTGIPACVVYSPSSWSCSHALQERHLSGALHDCKGGIQCVLSLCRTLAAYSEMGVRACWQPAIAAIALANLWNSPTSWREGGRRGP